MGCVRVGTLPLPVSIASVICFFSPWNTPNPFTVLLCNHQIPHSNAATAATKSTKLVLMLSVSHYLIPQYPTAYKGRTTHHEADRITHNFLSNPKRSYSLLMTLSIGSGGIRTHLVLSRLHLVRYRGMDKVRNFVSNINLRMTCCSQAASLPGEAPSSTPSSVYIVQ